MDVFNLFAEVQRPARMERDGLDFSEDCQGHIVKEGFVRS